jgi:hypothetical protein
MTPEPTIEQRLDQLTPPKIKRRFLGVKSYRNRVIKLLRNVHRGYVNQVKQMRDAKFKGPAEKLQWQALAVEKCITKVGKLSVMWYEEKAG